MTCIRIPNGIICVNPQGRLKIGNKYIWLDFHEYCGPTFCTDRHQSKFYEPVDENDPVWPEFTKWLKKFQAAKGKEAKRREKKSAAEKVSKFNDSRALSTPPTR